MNRIFIDTETTGLLKPDAAETTVQPYITELCLMKVDEDYNLIEEFDSFIKPVDGNGNQVPIPEEVTKITSITDATVANAQPFVSRVDELVEFFLGSKVLVGHNVTFDAGLLYLELTRLNLEFKFPWPNKWECTVEKSFGIEHRRLKLSYLHELATGHIHEGAHRAKADVYATMRVHHWLHSQGLV